MQKSFTTSKIDSKNDQKLIDFSCHIFLLISILIYSCSSKNLNNDPHLDSKVEIMILGTVQDAGSPQMACQKECCKDLWSSESNSRKVVCLGLADKLNNKLYLFEATPDLKYQWEWFNNTYGHHHRQPSGIFITHAHSGHYTGLLQVGRESMSSDHIPVFAMPGLERFLSQNGPWAQLINLGQIEIHPLLEQKAVQLAENIQVIPICVPHRDEYSETVGFSIAGPHKKVLFIPDIDKWDRWNESVVDRIKKHDVAFLDGTFYDGNELPGRDMAEIPHPFILESLATFQSLPESERNKIHFIHLNHTNPLLIPESEAYKKVTSLGFHVARQGDRLGL